ncbi:MAG TPA: rhodanese-like domain-containing protein [Bacilli bacterium]|jgi:rhodanese-related sulfurtransferase|nr:rhodanese-like domain-containing protein [Bacilli bacterium]
MFATITMMEFEQAIANEKPNIIDVREDYEFTEGHIPGAINIPMSTFIKNIDQLEKYSHYYVVCYSGARSDIAARYLDKQGYNATNVLGGMSIYKGPLEV